MTAPLRVHMVCGEDPDSWILGKFAKNLVAGVEKLGIVVTLGDAPDPNAHINHYVIFLHYPFQSPSEGKGKTTLMVTHVDDFQRLGQLKQGLESADLAICMSRQTVAQLAASGLPGEKLTFVPPAHDGIITPRPTIIGITTRIYDDGRKKEQWIAKLAPLIAPSDFSFRIMGEGWGDIAATLRRDGFEVAYEESFNVEAYSDLFAAIDYYLYLGEDEGSMGFVDALAAGVKTIVAPQGFHLDAPGGITYPVKSFADLADAFDDIAEQKACRTAAVADWTWNAYAQQHAAIWSALAAGESLSAHTINKTAEIKGCVSAGSVRWKFLRHSLWRRRQRLKRRLAHLKKRFMG
jgi:glycosyltransferase involved in cell wall biosynthesis